MSFFSELKEIFAPQKPTTSPRNENPNFITKPKRIIHMLKLLQDSATQLTVSLPDGSEFPSKILDVQQDAIILDQFNSSQAHKKISKNSLIEIHAKQQAVSFNFKSTVTSSKLIKLDGYAVSLPEKIYYPQKRAFFRIPLGQQKKINFSGTIEYSENDIDGYILDMSLGGISLAVFKDVYLKKDAILSSVSLDVSEGKGESIVCDLTIRSVKKSLREGYTRVGCQFLNIDSETKYAINAFINLNERKRAQNDQ